MDMPTKPKTAEEKAQSEQATDMPPEHPLHGIAIKGEAREGGLNPTRLYQTSPEVKEWLTQSEAETMGLYWKPDEDAPAPKAKKK